MNRHHLWLIVMSEDFKSKVQRVLDEKVRPGLQMDGGDIELIEADDGTGVVKVRLTGHCAGCPFSQMTLKMGVEAALKENIPEVSSVETA